jgi:hypothetical protein
MYFVRIGLGPLMWMDYSAIEEIKIAYTVSRVGQILPLITIITLLCLNNDYIENQYEGGIKEPWTSYMMWSSVGFSSL